MPALLALGTTGTGDWWVARALTLPYDGDSMACSMPGRTAPRHALKWYKTLATRKGRQAAGAFLVDGPRAIAHLQQQQPEALLEILTTDDQPRPAATCPVGVVTANQLRSISSTQTPQGLLAVVRLPAQAYADSLPANVDARVLLLEDIQDPGNLGTLVRTATAFGFSGVLLSERCADPFSPKCVQATAGTILSVWLRRTAQYAALVVLLKQRGYACVAADLRGEDDPAVLSTYPRLVLMLGNEAAGLSPALGSLAQARVKIPLSAQVDSLNVAMCGAICMYLSVTHQPGTPC